MKFGIVQKDKFNAVDGSYSIVTEREVYDSQITATDAEAELLKRYFDGKGEPIYVGNVQSNKIASAKQFRLYPSGKTISLNLVYPKPEKGELRLYLSTRAGFKPNKGEVWFLFVNIVGELWIGAMSESKWRQENSVYAEREAAEFTGFGDANTTEDKATKRQKRNPALALKRMQLSKYKCEYNHTHKLFIARATGCPFVNVHHVIPMGFQSRFPNHKLDVIHNLFSLCPNCHAIVHHAEESLAREVLSVMFDRREIGSRFNISKLDLFRLYSVEEITRE